MRDRGIVVTVTRRLSLSVFPLFLGPLQRLPPVLESTADHELAVFQNLRFGAALLGEHQFAAVECLSVSTVHRCVRGFGCR